MVSTTHLEPVANRLLLLTNILSAVRIDKLLVPEVIANDCLDAVLDCAYSGAANDVTVLWLHDGKQVYEWRHGSKTKVSGVLDGHIDLNYSVPYAGCNSTGEKLALRIFDLTPELSGDYTCVVRSRGQEARETKSMTVYSPERDFELTFSAPLVPDLVGIKCVAKRLHPQPELVIEYNKAPIAQQHQRIWRKGAYYDTECVALVPRRDLRPDGEIACRLQLPQIDYTAITKKYFNLVNQANGACVTLTSSFIIVSIVYLISIIK